jgi:hypothetical protein
MANATDWNLDEETIANVGLQATDIPINAHIAPNARVFRYPHLENIFIMESDLYGNTMPKGSCFLAFEGNHGLIGTHLPVATLKQASVEEIRQMIAANAEG